MMEVIRVVVIRRQANSSSAAQVNDSHLGEQCFYPEFPFSHYVINKHFACVRDSPEYSEHRDKDVL